MTLWGRERFLCCCFFPISVYYTECKLKNRNQLSCSLLMRQKVKQESIKWRLTISNHMLATTFNGCMLVVCRVEDAVVHSPSSAVSAWAENWIPTWYRIFHWLFSTYPIVSTPDPPSHEEKGLVILSGFLVVLSQQPQFLNKQILIG